MNHRIQQDVPVDGITSTYYLSHKSRCKGRISVVTHPILNIVEKTRAALNALDRFSKYLSVPN